MITDADFDTARDRIILGRREGSNVLLPDEKHAVAVHESGHAIVAALSEHADPVAKVTILPAGQTLGVTEQLPLVERHMYSEDYLYDSLAVRLGGRAAELVAIGQGSTGAANDLAGATDLAVKMVREFGLSRKLGPIGYPEGGSVFLGGGGAAMSSRPFAEATQADVEPRQRHGQHADPRGEDHTAHDRADEEPPAPLIAAGASQPRHVQDRQRLHEFGPFSGAHPPQLGLVEHRSPLLPTPHYVEPMAYPPSSRSMPACMASDACPAARIGPLS